MVKRTVTFSALVAGACFSYISIICIVSGFVIGKLGGGKSDGIEGRINSIVIPVGQFRLHLHHWLIGVMMMCVGVAKSIFVYIPEEVFYGMLSGFVWQGVYCYRDWHRVFYKVD